MMKHHLFLKEIDLHGNQFQKVRLLHHITISMNQLEKQVPLLKSLTLALMDLVRLHNGQEKSYREVKLFFQDHHHQSTMVILQL